MLSFDDFRAADEEVGKPHAIGIYNRHDLAEAPFYCCSESAADTAAWLEKLHAAAQGTYRVLQQWRRMISPRGIKQSVIFAVG